MLGVQISGTIIREQHLWSVFWVIRHRLAFMQGLKASNILVDVHYYS